MIRSGGLRGFQSLVASLGGDALSLLQRHRIAPESLDDEDALIPLRALVHLLEDSAETLDCADFGLRLARTQDISILGPVAVAIQHSATAADALDCASRYLFVHCPALTFSVLPRSPQDGALAELRFEVLLPNTPVSRQATELSLGVTHRMVQFLGREHYRLHAVCLPYSPIAPLSVYARYFGAELRVNHSHAALLVPRSSLDMPLSAANAALRQLAASYLDVHYPMPGQTVATRVRLAVSRSLGTGQARKDRVAEMLAMHPRTLQRHLAAEGTSFDAIRDGVSRESALRYLTATRMPFTQVAGLIGLSEQSALTRACRRWFGAPPSQVRRRALEPS